VGEYDKVYFAYFSPDILQLVDNPHKKGIVSGNFNKYLFKERV